MSASLGSLVQISVNLSRSSTLSRLALAMLLPSLSWSCADRPDEVTSGAVQSARARGPSGGYNQRDLDIARPYGGRARAEVARALEGSVDIHMHTHPDVVERPVDAFEAVDLALAYGLRGGRTQESLRADRRSGESGARRNNRPRSLWRDYHGPDQWRGQPCGSGAHGESRGRIRPGCLDADIRCGGSRSQGAAGR